MCTILSPTDKDVKHFLHLNQKNLHQQIKTRIAFSSLAVINKNKQLTQPQGCQLFFTVVIKTERLTEDSHSSRFKHETFFSVSGFHYHAEREWIQLVIDTISFTESHFALIGGSPVQHKMMLVRASRASRYLLQNRFDFHSFLRILRI